MPNADTDLLTPELEKWYEERARQRCANVLYADQETERPPQENGIRKDLRLALLKGRLELAQNHAAACRTAYVPSSDNPAFRLGFAECLRLIAETFESRAAELAQAIEELEKP